MRSLLNRAVYQIINGEQDTVKWGLKDSGVILIDFLSYWCVTSRRMRKLRSAGCREIESVFMACISRQVTNREI